MSSTHKKSRKKIFPVAGSIWCRVNRRSASIETYLMASTREASSLRFDFRRIDRGSANQRQSLVTAITIRLGKHPAGVSSGRTRPCRAVNLASAIISRVRRRSVPSRSRRCDQPTRKMDGSSRASSLLHRIYSARVSAWTSLRFRHSRPSPRPLRWTPLLLRIFGCEEWQHAHIQHRSERKEILHLEVVQHMDRDKRIKGKDALTSICRSSSSCERLTSTLTSYDVAQR